MNNHNCFAITATEQTKGRGTSGRNWIGHKGNAFVTIAIPFERVTSSLNGLLSLFPLQMGILLCKRIRNVFEAFEVDSKKVTVKWPNDVLVKQQKVAGILIESEVHANQTWFLVGIGVNCMVTPTVDKEGTNQGRDATCIYDQCIVDSETMKETSKTELSATLPKNFVIDLVRDVQSWIQASEGGSYTGNIVKEWEHMAEFGVEQVLRGANNEVVVPLGLEQDGQLRVRGSDGRERLLCTDYMI